MNHHLPVVHHIGEIVAPRFWVYDENYLYGPSLWRKQWPHNEPMHNPIGNPRFGRVLHGQYAFKELGYVYDWLAKNELPDAGVIVGTVRLWGSVLRAPKGWQAESARILSLTEKYLNGNIRISDDDDLRRLRQNYGVAL